MQVFLLYLFLIMLEDFMKRRAWKGSMIPNPVMISDNVMFSDPVST